jgi:hypothetical protein
MRQQTLQVFEKGVINVVLSKHFAPIGHSINTFAFNTLS